MQRYSVTEELCVAAPALYECLLAYINIREQVRSCKIVKHAGGVEIRTKQEHGHALLCQRGGKGALGGVPLEAGGPLHAVGDVCEEGAEPGSLVCSHKSTPHPVAFELK